LVARRGCDDHLRALLLHRPDHARSALAVRVEVLRVVTGVGCVSPEPAPKPFLDVFVTHVLHQS
jgi:hypothetical protein